MHCWTYARRGLVHPRTPISKLVHRAGTVISRLPVCLSWSLKINLIQLLITVRYLLPCLAGASVALTALIFGYFSLEETKGSKDKKGLTVLTPPARSNSTSRPESLKKSRAHRIHADSGTSAVSSSTLFVGEERSPSIKSSESRIDINTSTSSSALGLLRHPPLQRVITSLFISNILGTPFDVVFSLLCYTPIHLGGLSRTVRSLSCPLRYILTHSIAS